MSLRCKNCGGDHIQTGCNSPYFGDPTPPNVEPPEIRSSEWVDAPREKSHADCKPTGRRYNSVDEIVAELSPEVQAEYQRLRAESEGASTRTLFGKSS